MFPNNFDYYAPTSLNEVMSLLQSNSGDVKLLAGGQSLLPLMKLRLADYAALVDVAKVPELRGIAEEANSIVLGAMTTYFQAIDSDVVQRRCPLITQTLRQVGDPQVRARGTIGGSLAHADPAGDLPAVAVALDAQIGTFGPGGQRSIPAASFFTDLLTTALQENEVLTAVRFAATNTPHTGTAYVKHRHPASGYAVVGVAVIVRLNDDGTCAEARVGVTGAGTHATRASGVEQALRGQVLDEATIGSAAGQAANGLDLLSDPYASKDFRAHLTQVMTRRALAQAAEAARQA
ncbi:MAG: FAD binding domain-containing protein [Ktedonobacterales bacterium]